MRTIFCSENKKYLLPIIHFLLSFWYERRVFLFESGREVVFSIPKSNFISEGAERVMGYVLSKLFAAVLIFFLWHLIFWIIKNWNVRKNIRFFLGLFGICLIGVAAVWPMPFIETLDNYITYSFAIRFWPEYWHGAYTSFLYAASLMVVPSPVFITVLQLIFGVFVLGYLYNRILDSHVLRGKGKYFVFLIFLMPNVCTLFTDPYRTESYALLSMFAVEKTAMDVIDQKERGKISLVGDMLLCGFLSVWRSEGIILGVLLFLIQLLFVYRYPFRKSAFSFLGFMLAFGMFLVPQKLGDIKYYGKDYAFINTFPALRNILASADANLSYDGGVEDLSALEAVTPVELIRCYGIDGFRRYNNANGRRDFHQSLASDEVASAYMKAYYRILRYNLPIYVKTQVSMFLRAIMVIPVEYVEISDQPPVHDLPDFPRDMWNLGRLDFINTGYVKDWTAWAFHLKNFEGLDYVGMDHLSDWIDYVEHSSLFYLKVKNKINYVFWRTHFHSTILILIPLIEIFLFVREGICFLKKKKNYFGLAGIAFLLLGQAAAIVLVMPAGFFAYVQPYYYCSFILCLIYTATFLARR